MMLFDRRLFLACAGAVLALAASPLRAQMPTPVDEGGFVLLNGVEQWVTIRGNDRANPILVVLGGGPGVPTSYLAPALVEWERDFTVVLWDQPGSGATFMKNGGAPGTGEVTVDRFARDGLSLVEHVRAHLGQPSVVLLGYSWGSMVGLEMVARRPELFSAYLGTAQAIDVRRSDELSYALALEAARQRQDQTAIAALEGIGPPPFTFERRLVKQQYATAPSEAERARTADFGRILAEAPSEGSWVWPASLGQYDAGGAFLGTQRASFADAQAWSAAKLGDRFEIPLFFAQGEHDLNTVTPLVREFVDRVNAPHKNLIVIPGAGHGTFPYFHAELLGVLRSEVLPRLGR